MKIAVLVDAENIAAVHDSFIRSVAGTLGEGIIFRLFGNFADGMLQEWSAVARWRGYEVAHQPRAMPKKGSTDIALAISAMDILHDHIAEGLCIASTDSDFVPLARRLRAGGLEVFGIGRPEAPSRWREACTRFFATPEAEAQPLMSDAEAPMTASPNFRAALLKLIHDLADCSSDDGTVLPALVAAEIRRQFPGVYDLIGGEGRFLRNLERLGLVTAVGSGSQKRIRPTSARPIGAGLVLDERQHDQP